MFARKRFYGDTLCSRRRKIMFVRTGVRFYTLFDKQFLKPTSTITYMLVKFTYGYLTTINWFQYFLVFNLYGRIKKFEYISENSHIVISERFYITWLSVIDFTTFDCLICSEHCECTYIQFVEHIFIRRSKRLFR